MLTKLTFNSKKYNHNRREKNSKLAYSDNFFKNGYPLICVHPVRLDKETKSNQSKPNRPKLN